MHSEFYIAKMYTGTVHHTYNFKVLLIDLVPPFYYVNPSAIVGLVFYYCKSDCDTPSSLARLAQLPKTKRTFFGSFEHLFSLAFMFTAEMYLLRVNRRLPRHQRLRFNSIDIGETFCHNSDIAGFNICITLFTKKL
ncbi:hypothetical protein BT96DRAFT_1036493, partial [Gymnopus androsaceus JB14]